jgi:hypothetical protein
MRLNARVTTIVAAVGAAALLLAAFLILIRFSIWTRLARLVFGIMVFALIVVLITVALVVSRVYPKPHERTGSPSPQRLFQRNIRADERALDRGMLTYPSPAGHRAGRQFTLRVTVTDVGRYPRGTVTAAELSGKLGLVVYAGDIPTGANVGLVIVSSSNLSWQSLMTSAIQPVAGSGSSRTWEWRITPKTPGPASLLLDASTYGASTSTALVQVHIPIAMTVVNSSAFARAQTRRRRTHDIHEALSDIEGLAELLIAVGGAAAVVFGAWRWMVRLAARRRGKAEIKPQQEITEEQVAERRRQEGEASARQREETEAQKQDPVWRRPS